MIIQTQESRKVLAKINCAGSVFLGPWSPESVGDYASGTNHVLPTYGFAKNYSGLSVKDFMIEMQIQELSLQGLQSIAQTVMTLADIEGLTAHKQAVSLRLAEQEPTNND